MTPPSSTIWAKARTGTGLRLHLERGAGGIECRGQGGGDSRGADDGGEAGAPRDAGAVGGAGRGGGGGDGGHDGLLVVVGLLSLTTNEIAGIRQAYVRSRIRSDAFGPASREGAHDLCRTGLRPSVVVSTVMSRSSCSKTDIWESARPAGRSPRARSRRASSLGGAADVDERDVVLPEHVEQVDEPPGLAEWVSMTTSFPTETSAATAR